MFTAIRTQPGPALRSRSTTGRPTPVPSTASRHWPVRSGERVTCTTRSTTSVYGVPSAIRSRYRSCSDTTFFQANITASHSPFVSARSTAAIAVKSLLCPKSTPTKYQSIAPISSLGQTIAFRDLSCFVFFANLAPLRETLFSSPNHQRLDFIRDRALHQLPREHPAQRVLELAQVLLTEPALTHRGALLFQYSRPKPRAFRGRRPESLPFLPPVRPRLIEKSPLPERRAHQPQRPVAHRQHRPDRQVQFVAAPPRFVHQQQRDRREPANRSFRPRQPHNPRPVRQFQRDLVVSVALGPDPQHLCELSRFPQKFAALPPARAHHHRQALRRMVCLVYRFCRRDRRFSPLPAAIQYPSLVRRPQQPALAANPLPVPVAPSSTTR